MSSWSRKTAAAAGCLLLIQDDSFARADKTDGSSSSGSVTSKTLDGEASPNNFILHEETSTSLPYSSSTITVTSNVPVTVQRYYDDTFLHGQAPVDSNDGKVLVTSDCSTTLYVPSITWGVDSVDVYVQGVSGAADMPFLESSSYDASWSYKSYWCSRNPPGLKGRVREAFEPKKKLSSALGALVRRMLGTSDPAAEDEGALVASSLSSPSSSAVCTVNVEVMIDSCSHSVSASAPQVRYIDATLETPTSSPDPNDPCVYNYETDIAFEGDGTSVASGTTVPGVECHRPVPGRPFVDSSGRALAATPLIVVPNAEVLLTDHDGLECEAEACSTTSLDNRTVTIHHNQLLLGEHWTRNALGEHASVASFAAFSIALLTNGAPADLIQDALVAAQDQTRHAKASFEIASRLTGQEVKPGMLPQSKLNFEHDVKALALSVAREGCVDETLSALEAAAEVDLLDAVLTTNGGEEGTKYAGVDRETLAWIRDELRTIALEEGSHASLAWRTFNWACGVDAEACAAVKQEVLNEPELERVFQRRFGSFDAGSDCLKLMEESWRRIYSNNEGDGQSCVGRDASLVAAIADKVIERV